MPGSSLNTFLLMDDSRVKRTINRISREILEHKHADRLLIIGLNKRGFAIARKLVDSLQKSGDINVPCYQLDVNTDTPVFDAESLNGKDVLLVDDVIFSGKSMLKALRAVTEKADPESIRITVLIDRGHRAYPVFPTFTGMYHPTKLKEHVHVEIGDDDSIEVVLESDYGS